MTCMLGQGGHLFSVIWILAEHYCVSSHKILLPKPSLGLLDEAENSRCSW